MKKPITYTVMLTYFVWGLNTAVNASARSLERWQTDMPYQPSESVPERENSGLAQFSDGLLEAQVERIDNRFTRVSLADPSGEMLLHAETGTE